MAGPTAQQVPIDFALANARRIVERGRAAADGRFRRRLFRPTRGGRRQCRAARGDRRGRLQLRGPGDRRRGPPPARPAGAADRRDPRARSASDFFINARTDLFLKTQTYDDALVDQVIERGKAFADAGASGFFVPRPGRPDADRARGPRSAAAAQRHRLPRRAGQDGLGERGRRADQPRALPAPGADGAAREMARAAIELGARRQPPPLRVRGPDFSTVLRNSWRRVQDQRDPQRLPQDGERAAATSPGPRRRGRASPSATTSGKTAAASASVESGAPTAVDGEAEDQHLARRSPASTGSALRAPSRPGRRWSGRPRRAADSSSRNRRRRATRKAGQPTAGGGSVATPPVLDRAG